jgi:hypothetical protein
VKTRGRTRGGKKSSGAEPQKSVRPLARVPDAGSLPRQVPEEAGAAKNYNNPVRSYRFQRAKAPGIIEVLNENSYVMAEYSERTGSMKWQRMVLASQREQIEKWLEVHYPKA